MQIHRCLPCNLPHSQDRVKSKFEEDNDVADTEDSKLVNLDFSLVLPPEDPGNYGNGKWFWQKSNETYDRKHPYRTLLSASQRDVFDVLTFLAFTKKAWVIRASATYISKACAGNPAPRTIESHFAHFREIGFLELKHFDKAAGNVYLINPILMALGPASRMQFYDVASKLLDRVRIAEPDFRVPQKRLKKGERVRSKRQPMSRDEQLAYARSLNEKPSLEHGPANLEF